MYNILFCTKNRQAEKIIHTFVRYRIEEREVGLKITFLSKQLHDGGFN